MASFIPISRGLLQDVIHSDYFKQELEKMGIKPPVAVGWPHCQYILGPLEIERVEGAPDAVTYLFRRTLYKRDV